jgi:hypothetical protein
MDQETTIKFNFVLKIDRFRFHHYKFTTKEQTFKNTHCKSVLRLRYVGLK